MPEHNKIDLFNKNNENSLNENIPKPTFFNPLIKTNPEKILINNPINDQIPMKNNININFNQLNPKIYNSSINNYSFNIQNNLNFNNDRVSFNNKTWATCNDNAINFTNSLASKTSTDTFKVLENFDEYINQYENINQISNKAFVNSNNENDNLNLNNLRSPVIERNNFNDKVLNYNGENDHCKSNYKKNIFILDQERKNGLIKLNDSKNNLINLNQNPKAIIDLTNESNNVEMKLSPDYLEEILISCKDEQIERELFINKTQKKKEKHNNFI